jgi:hypothetical protein
VGFTAARLLRLDADVPRGTAEPRAQFATRLPGVNRLGQEDLVL